MNERNAKVLSSVGLAAVLLLGLAQILLFSTSNHIADDAFIFFRYVDNFFMGYGLTWNPGEPPVEGYSSFLYVALLMLPRLAEIDPVVAVHTLNVGLYMAVLVAAAWLMATILGGWRPIVLLAPLLLATSGRFALFARSGMETMLYALTILLALISLFRHPQRPIACFGSGLMFGLAALTRSEGLLFYLVSVAAPVAWDRRNVRGLLNRQELYRLLGLATLLLPHLVWRLVYYGELSPNTYHAKVELSFQILGRGLLGLDLFLTSYHGAFTLMAVALCLIGASARRNAGSVLLLQLVVWLAYVTVVLGVPHPQWHLRYSMPVALYATLCFGFGAAIWLESRPAPLARHVQAGLAVVLALAVVGNLGFQSMVQAQNRSWRVRFVDPPGPQRVNDYIAIGHQLRQIASPGETLAVGACGAIPYYSGLITYDTFGLNDKYIARTPMPQPRGSLFGHEKGDGYYILSRRPTYIIPQPQLTARPVPGYSGSDKSFIEIFASFQFRRDYKFESVQLADGRYFGYYRRRSPG